MSGRSFLWLLFLFTGVLFRSGPARADEQKIKVVISDDEGPVAPPLLDAQNMPRAGQGLCGAFRADPNLSEKTIPLRDDAEYFSNKKELLQNAINDFMDKNSGSLMAGERWDGTLLTPFDLTNETNLVDLGAKGDFQGTPVCQPVAAGCPFPPMNKMGNPQDGFGSRFRGFLHVPPDWVGQKLQFGFYSDDVVSVMIWTRKRDPGGDPTKSILVSHVLLSRGAVTGVYQYRVTNLVTFPKAGLYPIEIVHANYNLAAVLEFAVQSPSTKDPIDDQVSGGMPLSAMGFSLGPTQPKQFFQTVTGALAYPDPAKCQQCKRSDVNQRGMCGDRMFCNEAAVCAPCQGDLFCGSTCTRCSEPKPFCVQNPTKTDFECVQCREDKDCAQGLKCVQGSCVNPCTCCPDSPFCIETDIKAHPGISSCSQCKSDADCGTGKCDLLNARCADSIPECNEDARCGAECVNCREISKDEPNGPRPYCLYGKSCAQCRMDSDCKPGTFCRSGDCIPCTHDRHCGPSCASCGLTYQIAPDGKTVTTAPADKPYCLSPGGQLETSTCVSCLVDAHCPGGKCNPTTHECDITCRVACDPSKLCAGDRCVDCVSSSQCPCGQCVDGACTPTCADTTDCSSTQCCQKSTGQCVREKCAPGAAAGGALCCSTTNPTASVTSETGTEGTRSPSTKLPLLTLLAMLALLYRLRPSRRQA